MFHVLCASILKCCIVCPQDNIVLIGHSAGAHLCALTTLFLISGAEEIGIETTKQTDITSAIKGILGKYYRPWVPRLNHYKVPHIMVDLVYRPHFLDYITSFWTFDALY